MIPTAEGWTVTSAGKEPESQIYRTQAEAKEAARAMVRVRGGGVRVQGKDGRWQESFTIGQEGITKISAVEGIRLSRAMTGAFRRFDRHGLSAADRRKAIAKAFGKKP